MRARNEQELRFVGDDLYVYTPLPQYGEGICKIELVMTKEIFQECYKRWIESEDEENKDDKYVQFVRINRSSSLSDEEISDLLQDFHCRK